jgi:dTDP-4-amino-4,6-dideoxygalactose transaminase
MYKYPLNKPFIHGRELMNIAESVSSGKISGDGIFTKKCHELFKIKYNINNLYLTTSCTDALEIAAISLEIKEGDEIIMPSYTFVSSANAFVLRGAKIIFIDSQKEHPNIDASQIVNKITDKTKAILVVHYAGIACDMEIIMEISRKYNIPVVEDAAQAIDSKFKNEYLGTIGAYGTYSFHETKNINCGEGGAIIVNDIRCVDKVEIIREKGTNRSAFLRGEYDKYTWVGLGSSFLPSDILAAYLYAQLENIEQIQAKRKSLWKRYNELLEPFSEELKFETPNIPPYATNNAHIFYIVLKNEKFKIDLIDYLKTKNILSASHYVPLHSSPFFKIYSQQKESNLPNCDKFSEGLLRLPLYHDLNIDDVEYICSKIISGLLNIR